MAEIRVHPKPRSRAWLWVLLFLAVAALVAWYLLREGLVTVQQTGALPAASGVVLALAAAGASAASAAPARVLRARGARRS